MNPLNRCLEMLKVHPLTEAEGELMATLLACGPFDTRFKAEGRLIELGLAERDAEDGALDATLLARRFFYEDNGSVRAPFRWW